MSTKTISQLPAAPSVSGSAVVATDNAAGTETQKVLLSEIAGLAPSGNLVVSHSDIANLTVQDEAQIKQGTIVATLDERRWMYSGAGDKLLEASYTLISNLTPSYTILMDVPADFPPSYHTHPIAEISDFPVATANGQVVQWDANIPAWIAGAGGGGGLPQPTNTGDVIQWDGGAYIASNQLLLAGITFSDLSTQSTAAVPLPTVANQYDVLTYDTGNWVALPPSGGLPGGMGVNDVLTWDGMQWLSLPIPAQVPTSANYGEVLMWDNSNWVAVQASTPSFPFATQGQYLVYDGFSWIATNAPVPGGSSQNDMLYWDSGLNSWYSGAPPNALPSASSAGDMLFWDGSNNTWLTATPPAWIAPSAPANEGNIVRYNSMNGAWDPARLLAGLHTTQNSDTPMQNGYHSFLGLTLEPMAHYTIEGVAIIAYQYDTGELLFGLEFFNQGDGAINLVFDKYLSSDPNAPLLRPFRTEVQGSNVAALSLQAGGGEVVIRFRALVVNNNNGTSTFQLGHGNNDTTNNSQLKTGSYMVATPLAWV